MKITVFIKQVPDTDDVKWTSSNNIDRANTESILNPADSGALAAAFDLKEKYSAAGEEGKENIEITAFSMGPAKAEAVLKEAIAMGADNAALLCDSKFIGSDTCATSKVLAAAVKKITPESDLLLFGQSASDGETAQTGPETAVRLGLPFAGHITEITEIKDGYVFCVSETEAEKTVLKIKLPAVLCIYNYKVKPRLPLISGYMRAHDYCCKTYNIYELKLNEDETGIKGSPTYVSKAYKTSEGRNCTMLDKQSLLEKIKEAANDRT